MRRVLFEVRHFVGGLLSRAFGRRSTLTLNLIGMGLAAGIGWLDYLSGPELVLSMLYFIPVGISTWYRGISSGVLLSCVSVATMFAVDIWTRQYDVLAFAYLNAAVRLAFFLFVTYLIRRRRIAEERIRELMEVKSEFTAMVSHELRTPLASIKEGLALVTDEATGALSDHQQRYLDIVGRNVDRLDRLVTNVLDFQKLDAGRMDFVFEPCDVNALVSSVVNTFAPGAAKRGVELRADAMAGLPEVICDRDKITQVVSNLLDNALKFATQGCVRVTTGRDGHAVSVAVQDQGAGIPREELPRLFQRFTQLRAGDGKSDGTGLGLAISKKIIDSHHGRIGVTSVIGQGSTFFFTLPLHQPASSP